MTPTQTYTVELDNFHGPLDLLLSLIERRELEVTDVSVGQVTSDYLATVAALEKVKDAELSWFLDIATRLIFYKARALGDTTSQEEEGSDLAELTQELSRYKVYRQLAQNLSTRLRPLTIRAQSPKTNLMQSNLPPRNLSLTVLQSAYRAASLLAAQSVRPTHTVTISRHDIATMMQQVLTGMQKRQRLTEFFRHTSRRELTLRLLALLELAKQGAVDIFIENETSYVQAT